MWDNETIMMLVEGTRDTLYMTLMSTLFGYVLGLPMGILLTVTDQRYDCSAGNSGGAFYCQNG